VPAIQDTGKRSPEASEVRYYFDSDLPNATKVVASAKEAGVNVSSPRKMQTMTTARAGLLELWIGKNDLAAGPTATDNTAHAE
jgi:hypothetical protein